MKVRAFLFFIHVWNFAKRSGYFLFYQLKTFYNFVFT